ncbi:radical SAM family heme chaperone HemW [Chlorobium sp.]|uniref:radical SAM family heme chaperone HemW n=1 Tax=Chlorobium sp. TaxID=1095 RepID=UPI0025BFE7A9|nr:radical SAM family heme chaperone HemW [Chlorobium sp.]
MPPDPSVTAGELRQDEGRPLSLYVHVPFCSSRCSYCDFFLVTRLDHIEAFFRALAIETCAAGPLFRGRSIKSVHFGGGTPSLVPVRFLAGWLELAASLCTFSSGIEIALEANPEDLSGDAMEELKAAGINRISLGVQSYRQRKLSALGRRHSAEDAMRITTEAVSRFDSVSIDLICGVPGESTGEWLGDLQAALALAAPHISVYMLSVEPKTLLERRIARGLVKVPDEGVQASMYAAAIDRLSAGGYHHYEVSNFAFPGHHSRYNLACWMREPYLGFGPSAHSFMTEGGIERRRANAPSLLRYFDNPAESAAFEEVLSEDERFVEHVFLSLRINRGLDVEFLRKHNKLGLSLPEVTERFIAKEWIVIENGQLLLTAKGFLFADHIAGELISL